MARVTRIGFTSADSYKNIQGKVVLAPDIFSVDYDQLSHLGVKRLVFDYDGTLASRWGAMPSAAAMKLLFSLQEHFEIVVYSNNWLFWKRRQHFFSAKNIAYKKTQKPLRLERDEEKPTVIIGDKWLTDRLYAWSRRWGCVLVGKSA